jgi:hypothetical protein
MGEKTADRIRRWAILPRLMTIMFSIMGWRCADWFMSLENPDAVQMGFVSVVMGAMTGAFAIWMGHEKT